MSDVLGVVAAGHPLTCEAAESTLRAGGNAFDAALSAGFASAVTEPMLTSLGGGGFLLARTASGEEVLFDFFADTPGRGLRAGELEPHFLPMTVHFPASEQIFNIGLGSVAVPGALAGFLHVHERLGRIELERVIAPALAFARDGVPLNAHQAYALELLIPIHTLTERGRTLYSPGERTPREGERLANPELADLLAALPAAGRDAFYGGPLAARIDAEMRAGQGLLTEADLAGYRVIEREPLSFDYAGRRILTNPPPSFGGSLVALSLRLHAALGSSGTTAGRLHQLVAVMAEVDASRDGDRDEADSEAWVESSLTRLRATGGTTHISVCDGEGNAASMTLSNGEGSGYVAPGTGILLNNMLGEDDLHPDGFHASPPGERVASMMTPLLVLRDGGVELILGSGGSKRIRTALVQVLTGCVDHGLSIRAAVEAPRLHWDGERIQLEPGFDAADLEGLARSWPLNHWPERNLYFGGVHGISVPSREGAGDPRRGGAARRIDT